MSISVVFLTRRCPRACDYCKIRDAVDVGPELTKEEWKKAFSILQNIGVEFLLVLGNEPWILKEDLLDIMGELSIPYGLYTSCPPFLFDKYRDKFFPAIRNVSCGIDWPISYLEQRSELKDDSQKKSLESWSALQWIKHNYPQVECHASITIHKKNVRFLSSIVNELSELGVFSAINLIHWDKDGKYDFFPTKEEISDIVLNSDCAEILIEEFNKVKKRPGLAQNVDMLDSPIEEMLGLLWHCGGNPYGGPTIDSDGKLRVCGYRRGKYTPKFSIFDLPQRMDEWRTAVEKDAKECPGCFWPCPWMYHHMQEFGIERFTKHAAPNTIASGKVI